MILKLNQENDDLKKEIEHLQKMLLHADPGLLKIKEEVNEDHSSLETCKESNPN